MAFRSKIYVVCQQQMLVFLFRKDILHLEETVFLWSIFCRVLTMQGYERFENKSEVITYICH